MGRQTISLALDKWMPNATSSFISGKSRHCIAEWKGRKNLRLYLSLNCLTNARAHSNSGLPLILTEKIPYYLSHLDLDFLLFTTENTKGTTKKIKTSHVHTTHR